MKTINVRDLQKRIRECIETAQKEGVVLTRHGKPVAIVTGVAGYDWEDLFWATRGSFWKMIQSRRGEKTIGLQEVRKRFGARRGFGSRRDSGRNGGALSRSKRRMK